MTSNFHVTSELPKTMTLTAKRIRDVKPLDATRIEWDDDVKGLGLRITKSGSKSFVLSYRIDGRKRLLTLGRTSEITLADVRGLAGRTLIEVRSGIDPLESRNARRSLPTVSEGLDQYLNNYIPSRQKKGRITDKTVYEYKRQIEKYIRPNIGNRRIKDIDRKDVEKVLAPLPPVMANRVCALLSALFNKFEYWDFRPQRTNPTRGIERSVEEPRDRTLSEIELSKLASAFATLEQINPSALLSIKLAALTGLRISEILNLRWKDIDRENGLLVLPTSKTGRITHTLPTDALDLLESTARQSEYIIPGRFLDKPLNYSTARKHWVMAREYAGIHDINLHDLRRTLMTYAYASGAGPHLLRDLLGHKTTAMADRYIRRAGAPVRELREKIGSTMAAKINLVDGKDTQGSQNE